MKSNIKEKYESQSHDIRWKNIIKNIIERDNIMCKRCNSISKLVVHHIVYRYKETIGDLNIWDVNYSDLITLCSDCYKSYHETHSVPYMVYELNPVISQLDCFMNSMFIKKYRENDMLSIDLVEDNRNTQAFENALKHYFEGGFEKTTPEKKLSDFDIDGIVDSFGGNGYDWLD